MKRILLLFTVLQSTLLFGQKLDHASRTMGYGQFYHAGIWSNSTNHTVVSAGSYNGSDVQLIPGSNSILLPNASSKNGYLLRSSEDGQYLQHLGIPCTNVLDLKSAAYRENESLVVGGYFRGEATFDGPGGTVTTNSGTLEYPFVAKYNEDFSLSWVNPLILTAGWGYGSITSVDINSLGEVFVTGYYWGEMNLNPNGTPVVITAGTTLHNFVVKYAPDGTYMTHFANIGRGMPYLKLNQQDEVIITTKIEVVTDFDPGAGAHLITPTHSKESVFSKYNSNLEFISAISMKNSIEFMVYSMNIDPNDNILLNGVFRGEQDFNPGPGEWYLNSGSPSTHHTFLLKLSPNFSFEWVKHLNSYNSTFYGDFFPQHISFDSSNNIYLTGSFMNPMSPDFQAGTAQMTPLGTRDCFVSKYTQAGNNLWSFHFGNTTNFSETMGHSIQIDEFGLIRLIGFMRTVSDFDPSPYEQFGTLGYSAFYNGFYARYNQLKTGDLPAVLCAGSEIDIPFSNPYNLKADNIYTAEISDASGNFSNALTIGALSSGQASGLITATIPADLPEGSAYRIRIKASSPQMTSERNAQPIAISALPSFLNQSGSSELCAGQSHTLLATTTNASSMQWLFNGQPVSGEISNQLQLESVNTSLSGIYTLLLSNSCGTVESENIQLTIHEIPELTPLSSLSVCAGEEVSIALESSVNHASITWTNSNSSIGLSEEQGTTYAVNFIAVNQLSESQISTFTATAINSICESSPVQMTIEVKPMPELIENLEDMQYCAWTYFETIELTSTLSEATIHWTNSNNQIGLPESGSGNIPMTWTSNETSSPLAGTLSVHTELNGCASEVQYFTITVNPVFETELTITVCKGASVELPDGHIETEVTADFTYTAYLNSQIYSCDSTVYVTILVEEPVIPFLMLDSPANTINITNGTDAIYTWFNCTDQGIIQTGSMLSLEITSDMEIQVESDNGICQALSDCQLFSYTPNTASIEESEMYLHIYPNPTFEKIYLISHEEILHIAIYQANGALFQAYEEVASNSYSIDISAATSGLYYIRTTTNSGVRSMSLVKK